MCNWCTYLGADLAGTSRLEYPANVRIIRLPCTGRIDFNLIVKAFEMRADAVLVSGCHPGDCHYNGRQLSRAAPLDAVSRLARSAGLRHAPHSLLVDLGRRRKKLQQTVTEITEKTRELGPYKLYEGKPVRRTPLP